jgi:hypothetical protein
LAYYKKVSKVFSVLIVLWYIYYINQIKTNIMGTEVYIQATAFDKNSNDNTGRSIVADTKESFNRQVEEFESSIPYTKFYVTLVSDDVLTPEQELIISDYEVE